MHVKRVFAKNEKFVDGTTNLTSIGCLNKKKLVKNDSYRKT